MFLHSKKFKAHQRYSKYLTKERVEKGVRRKAYVRNRNENWRHDMALIYRGSKVTPETNREGAEARRAGVYRGVKHDGSIVEKSSQLTSGSYRGVNWG